MEINLRKSRLAAKVFDLSCASYQNVWGSLWFKNHTQPPLDLALQTKKKRNWIAPIPFFTRRAMTTFFVSLLRFCQLHFHELVRHFVLHSLVDFFCLYSGSVMPWCCSLSLSFDIYTKPFAVLTQEEKVRLVELYAILHLFTIVRSLFLYFFCCCCVCWIIVAKKWRSETTTTTTRVHLQ